MGRAVLVAGWKRNIGGTRVDQGDEPRIPRSANHYAAELWLKKIASIKGTQDGLRSYELGLQSGGYKR